eukprot:1194413-Rhodomonas_salina.1
MKMIDFAHAFQASSLCACYACVRATPYHAQPRLNTLDPRMRVLRAHACLHTNTSTGCLRVASYRLK